MSKEKDVDMMTDRESQDRQALEDRRVGTGEPAFPGDGYVYGGMTLRDYFAGQAITGSMTRSGSAVGDKRTAERAYEMADAMLAGRAELPDAGGDK